VLFFADTVEFFAIKSLEVPSSRSFYFALTLERTPWRGELRGIRALFESL
jgi:hypothetical protein